MLLHLFHYLVRLLLTSVSTAPARIILPLLRAVRCISQLIEGRLFKVLLTQLNHHIIDFHHHLN